MSDAHASTKEHKPHILPVRTYAMVFVALLFLTWLTVKVSYMDFGIFNMIVGLAIASIKAVLVVLFFMHMKYDEKFNWIIFTGCLGFLAVFFVLTLADTMERGRVDPLEEHLIEAVPARPELLDAVRDDHDAETEGTAGKKWSRGQKEGSSEGNETGNEAAEPGATPVQEEDPSKEDSGGGGH
jgi:cytochrome c oxidase subunit 4